MTTPGTVIEDVRFVGGTITIAAPNVTLRRVEVTDANVMNDPSSRCSNGLVIEDSEFHAGSRTSSSDPAVIGSGGYTLRNVLIDGVAEGPRVGGKPFGCEQVTIVDTFIGVSSPTQCGDWHGDGIQGYGGVHVTIRNTTIDFDESDACAGTAAFFYPAGQGNTSVDIDGLLVAGGGYPFRLGMPGRVENLMVVDRSWGYGPLEVDCRALSAWSASIVRLDAAGQPTPIRTLTCSSS